MPHRPWTPEPRGSEEDDREREGDEGEEGSVSGIATPARNMSGGTEHDTNQPLFSSPSSRRQQSALRAAARLQPMSPGGNDDVDMDDRDASRPQRSPGRTRDANTRRGLSGTVHQSRAESSSAMDVDVGHRRRAEETEVERAISVDKGKGRGDLPDALTWYLPDRLRGQPIESVIVRLQKNAHLFWRNEKNANMILVIPSPGVLRRHPPRPPPPQSSAPNRPPPPPGAPPGEPFYPPFPPDGRPVPPYWGPAPPGYAYPYWPPPPPPPIYAYPPPPPPMREYDYPSHGRTASHSRRDNRRSASPDGASRPSMADGSARHRETRSHHHHKTKDASETSSRSRQKSPSPRRDSVPPAFPTVGSGPPPSRSRESPYALRPEYPGYPSGPYQGYDSWYGDGDREDGRRRSSGASDRGPRPPGDDDSNPEETITYHVHKEYFLTQCSLIRFLYSQLDKHAPTQDIANPIESYSFQPAPPQPYHLPQSTLGNPRIHLNLPDPDSFGQILEWLYFGASAYPHLEEAMRSGQVTWGGLVRNAEWLGISVELKNWLGRHWKKSMEEGRMEKDLGNKPIGSPSPSPARGQAEQPPARARSSEMDVTKEPPQLQRVHVEEKIPKREEDDTPMHGLRSPRSRR